MGSTVSDVTHLTSPHGEMGRGAAEVLPAFDGGVLLCATGELSHGTERPFNWGHSACLGLKQTV